MRGGKTASIPARKLTKAEMVEGAQLAHNMVHARRPQIRAECVGMPRPCPFVSCRYHLYLDVNEETGTIKLNFPDKEIWEMKETCTLDAASEDHTLEEVGNLINITRERTRQVQVEALIQLRQAIAALSKEVQPEVVPPKVAREPDKMKMSAVAAPVPPKPLPAPAKPPPVCTCCGPNMDPPEDFTCSCGCLEDCKVHGS